MQAGQWLVMHVRLFEYRAVTEEFGGLIAFCRSNSCLFNITSSCQLELAIRWKQSLSFSNKLLLTVFLATCSAHFEKQNPKSCPRTL